MLNRKLYNTAIVEKLKELVNKHPDLRFGQILVDAGIIRYYDDPTWAVKDPFYEEPSVMWDRMKNNKFVFND